MQKTVISIEKPVPQWAKWVYRIVFLLTTSASIYIAGTRLISDDVKYELILLLKFIDPVIYGAAQVLGVDTKIPIRE